MLCELLNPACIELDIKAKRKQALIRELVELLCRAENIGDADDLFRRLMEREDLGSTGIGNGVAIPHCQTSLVRETHLVFGRKQPGIPFNAADNQPVSLFFLLVGPEDNHMRHLQILSRMARYLHDSDFRLRLHAAATAAEVIGAFREKETV